MAASLRPGIAAHVEMLGEIIAVSAEHLGLTMLQRLSDPFAASSVNAIVTRRTPGGWSWIIWVVNRPEEPPTRALHETICNVLADIGSLPVTVDVAMDTLDRHCVTRSPSKSASLLRGRSYDDWTLAKHADQSTQRAQIAGMRTQMALNSVVHIPEAR